MISDEAGAFRQSRTILSCSRRIFNCSVFLQAWFYFGLLHSVLGVQDRVAEFVRTDEHGNGWIDSHRLPHYCNIYQADRISEDLEELQKRIDRDNEDVIRITHLARSFPHEVSKPNVGLPISIQLLLDCLCFLQEQSRHWRSITPAYAWAFSAGVGAFLIDATLRERGWCHSLIE